jgi:VWFA-related protein
VVRSRFNSLAFILCLLALPGVCQRGGQGYGTGPQLISVGGGPGNIEQQVAAIDFAQIQLDEHNRARKETEKQKQARKELVDSGAVSALDLAAPNKAIREYNDGIAQMRSQHAQAAISHFEKAVALYPKFVSAYNALGLAYTDLDDGAKARAQFEAAVQLDGKYARSLLNLGRLSVSEGEYASAKSSLARAASTRPNDAEILTALAYAEHGLREYQEAIQTVERIHQLPHTGMGNSHYIAAAAGLALNDDSVVQRELKLFIDEDPSNALAPDARRNLELLSQNKGILAAQAEKVTTPTATTASRPQSLANSNRLKAELSALNGGAADPCADCQLEAKNSGGPELEGGAADIPGGPLFPSGNSWTIRKVVDEVALFFAVSSHGHMVNDLVLSDIQIHDDGKPPVKILQFAPQSKLPLRVGLLVDTSGSVQERFGFEKHAAGRFLQLLTNPSDLAFVAGFANSPSVVQDFTSNHEDLGKGIDSLKNGGGTALFDAVSYACGKLAAYPEGDRVAKVLVVLSDGEDNSSHTTLRRAISDAENSGVTIYAISTKDTSGPKTDADKVLEALAERSGGEALFPQDSETLHRSFDKLRDIIRSRYLVAYKPADFTPNGKYRTIAVRATKDGNRLQVHTRTGYHARVAPAGSD